MSGLIVGMTFRRLPSSDHPLLLVAVALAEQADSDGKGVFPSLDLIATETRLSRRCVQYKIADLQEIGFLVLIKKGGGRNNPNVWHIDVDWLLLQPDRVKAMRAEKESKNQNIKISAPPALFAPSVGNLGNQLVDNPHETVHKPCTNGALVGAPNPPTPFPSFKPPLDELVEAGMWEAGNSARPPRKPGAYRATLIARMRQKISQDDITCWRRWLRWQEDQHQVGLQR